MSAEEVDRAVRSHEPIDRYEVAVQREMLGQARRMVRLECAVQSAINTLEIAVLPIITEEWRRPLVIMEIERLKRALAEKEI